MAICTRMAGAVLAVLLAGQVASGQEEVPEWFRFDAAQPYAVFDAWKSLSTREAAICLGETWKVLAGRLLNERGEPVRNCPITIRQHMAIRTYSVNLRTDDRGYFLVYSPYSLDLDADENPNGRIDRRCLITAWPGYPDSDVGRAFAYQNKYWRPCLPKRIVRDDERAYYELTCDDASSFEAKSFAAFEHKRQAQKGEPQKPWRDRPRDPEGEPDGRIVRQYEVRLVDDADKPVAGALVKYLFSGNYLGCSQIRETDAAGRCRLEEWLLPRQAAGDERPDDYIRRVLTVDAPGFGVGPVTPALKAEAVNVIRLPAAATVTGRVVDHEGKPLISRLTLQYKRPNGIGFETAFHSRTDGTFRFERVMPNEEFSVTSDGFDFRRHQQASGCTPWISLKPGQVGGDLKLKVPLAAALRGIFVTADGRPAPVGDRDYRVRLDYGTDLPQQGPHYVGTDNGPWGPHDGRFGFYGLDDHPFQIRAEVPGWEAEPLGPITLSGGELRFVRITLKRAKGK